MEKKLWTNGKDYTVLPAGITPAPGWEQVKQVEMFEHIAEYFGDLAERMEGEWEDV